MKKKILVLFIIMAFMLTFFADKRTFEFVSFDLPQGWQEKVESGSPYYMVYNGNLNPDGTLEDGALFFLFLDNDVNKALVEDMKKDEKTFITGEKFADIKQMDARQYSGYIETGTGNVDFEVYAITEEQDFPKQLVITKMWKGVSGANLKSQLEAIFASVEFNLNNLNNSQIVVIPTYDYKIILKKNLYYKTDKDIEVEYSAPGNPKDWVGLYKVNASDRDFISWKHTPDKTGILRFDIPSDTGSFEFRFYKNDGYELVSKSEVFNISEGYSVTFSNEKFYTGEEMEIGYSSSGNQKDWIGLYKKGAAGRDYVSWKYVEPGKNSLKFVLPTEEGQYEFRLYANDGYDMLAFSSVFLVEKKSSVISQTGSPKLYADKSSYSGNEVITVYYSGFPQNDKCWIGLYKTISDNRSYIVYFYINGNESGSVNFTVPDETAVYNVRAFSDEGYNLLISSGNFKVTALTKKTVEDVQVVDAVLCTGIDSAVPVGIKDVFDGNYDDVCLWTELSEMTNSHTVLWKWISPNGNTMNQMSYEVPDPKTSGIQSHLGYCVWAWLEPVDFTGLPSGVYKVEMFIDNVKKYEEFFRVEKSEIGNLSFKTVEIQDLTLDIPVNAQLLMDETDPDTYYVLLYSQDNSNVLLAIQFAYYDNRNTSGSYFAYNGSWFSLSGYENTVYSNQIGGNEKYWNLILDNFTDNYGRRIFFYATAPAVLFESYRDIFTRIFDSMTLIIIN